MPKVSVIIPSYNHAPFLERRLTSVLDQTYRDFEVIVLDDASTDNSRAVFERLAAGLFEQSRTGILPVSEMAESSAPNGGSSVARPPVRAVPTGRDRQDACPTFSRIVPAEPRSESIGLPVRTVFNEVNSGSPFRQWNKGVELAGGEYVWIAESDDAADPRFLERLVPLLDAHPNVGLACCASTVIDDQDRVIDRSDGWWQSLHPTRWRSDFVSNGPEECARYLLCTNTIPNASAVLFRRDLYQRLGGADETMRFGGDWMMWVKMLLNSDIAYVAEPLSYWRKHANTVSAAYTDSALHLVEKCRITVLILRQATVPADVRDEAGDALVKRWVNLTLGSVPKPSWGDHWQILRATWPIDPKIAGRMLRRLIRHQLDTKPALAPLRPVARSVARVVRRLLGHGTH